MFQLSHARRDLNVANKVAFHNSVHMTCVTLEGDVVSPGGDMSGGAQKTGGSVLADLDRFSQISSFPCFPCCYYVNDMSLSFTQVARQAKRA